MLSAVAFAQQDSGKIEEITIRGNKRVSTPVIKANMRVKEGQLLNIGALKDDCQRIRDMGWFMKVDYTTTNSSSTTGSSWKVVIDVQEYEVVKEVAIVGNTNKEITTEMIKKAVTFNPAPGTKDSDLKPFNNSEMKPTGDAIAKLYTEKGYFGRVEGVGPDPYSPTTVIIKIRESTVNSVTIKGFTSTRQRVFDRLIKTKPGQPFSFIKWNKDYNRVLNTQWFENINPSLPSQSDQDEGQVDLTMEMNDARTGLFNAGLVLDPQNSLAGAISYSDSNFMGTGQSIGFNFTQATRGVGGSISFDYANPFIDASDTTFRASIYDRLIYRFSNGITTGTSNSVDTYQERRTGITSSITKPMSDKISYSYSGRIEKINTLNAPLNPPVVPYVRQDGEVGSIGFSSISNTRDLDFDPSKGSYLRIDLEPGYSVIKPSTVTDLRNPPPGRYGFAKLGFDFRTYYTKNKKPRGKDDLSREVVAFRLKAGTETGTVPFFEQYFAGGNDSVRGYNEDRFWGKNMFVSTIEYRKPIQEQFSIVGFADYGGAWGGYSGIRDFEQTKNAAFHFGYGLGLRFRTPLGPIRLDYAFNDKGGSRAHFMIGTSF
jgi:outer membrane protein insertion porin family